MAAKRRFRIGSQIRAPQLRVIDAKNQQLGVIATAEAQAKANELGLDLVEISPNADPPVARIMDFGKFKYEQDKQQQKHKKTRAGQVKEIRLTMKIGPHDLEYRMERARLFLAEQQKVKFNLMLKGRENANPKQGFERLKELIATIPDVKMEAEPTRAGRSISAVVTATKAAPADKPKDRKDEAEPVKSDEPESDKK